MATVSDTLETILKLVGGPQYIAGMQSAAKATGTMATAQASTTKAAGGLTAGISSLAAGLTGATAIIAATGAALIGLAKPFADAEQSAFRAAATLKNFGSDLSFKELAAFADRMQAMTGVDDDAIISLGALGAQFGLTRDEILKTIPVVADLAARSGQDMNKVFETLVRATRGRKQGLISLGIDPALIKGDISDINNLLAQVSGQVQGFAKLNAQTLKGEFTAAVNQGQDALESFGSVLQPIFSPLLKFLKDSAEGWELLFNLIRKWLEARGWAKASIDERIGGTAGAAAGLGRANRDSDNLEQIAQNTKATSEAIIRQAFGGPGTVGKSAGNIRALRNALGNGSF